MMKQANFSPRIISKYMNIKLNSISYSVSFNNDCVLFGTMYLVFLEVQEHMSLSGRIRVVKASFFTKKGIFHFHFQF